MQIHCRMQPLPLLYHLWLQPASISKEVPLLAQSAAGSCGWTIKSFYCYAHTYSQHNTTQAAPRSKFLLSCLPNGKPQIHATIVKPEVCHVAKSGTG